MKQNISKKKRKKIPFKSLFYFAIIQTIIGLLFLLSIRGCFPIEKNQTKETTIVVEDTAYWRGWNQYEFSIFSKSIEYSYPCLGALGPWASVHEMAENIKIGDKITIVYEEQAGLTQTRFLIVEARTQTDVFLTMEDFNEQRVMGYRGLVVILIILELICLFFFVLSLWLDRTQERTQGTVRRVPPKK